MLDQLFCAYQDSHETDPPEIKDGFKELDTYLRQLSLDDNNAVWNLCCRLCTAYEHKAFIDGFHYGVQLMKERITAQLSGSLLVAVAIPRRCQYTDSIPTGCIAAVASTENPVQWLMAAKYILLCGSGTHQQRV